MVQFACILKRFLSKEVFMDTNDIKDKLSQSAKHAASEIGSEVTQSGEDWLSYIKDHPLQSVLFGIIGYYALKGIIHAKIS